MWSRSSRIMTEPEFQPPAELAELAERVDAEQGSSGADDPAGETFTESPAGEARDADPMMAAILAEAVAVVGTIITSRFNVSPLAGAECVAIAEAGARVMAQYDLADLSPRAAAWIGLGIAIGGAALPRVKQYHETVEATAEPVGDPPGDRVEAEGEPVGEGA